MKKTSSFLLDEEVWSLLKMLADKQTRSQAKQLEVLIREAAAREGITLPRPKH